MQRIMTTAFLAATLSFSGAVWAADDAGQQSDQGTAEDILQSPSSSDQSGSMGSSDQNVVGPSDQQGTQETAVPAESTTVSGKIKSLDKKSGYFTLRTDDGKDMRLHADPKLLKEQNVKKGAEVTASYEMRGKMKHVTTIQEGGAARSPSEMPGQAPSGGGMR